MPQSAGLCLTGVSDIEAFNFRTFEARGTGMSDNPCHFRSGMGSEGAWGTVAAEWKIDSFFKKWEHKFIAFSANC